MKNLDWPKMRKKFAEEIDLRLRCLEAGLRAFPTDELKEKYMHDLVMPNIGLLAQFCENVKIEDEHLPEDN